ncbi:hypothetical protein, conserved [Trypanosoma brucei gambiense DAL972]|uniref:Uncharacterized protein n=1 Tax=Trypanosoma brucei gambiense (strain MHOM/CI/86/DAL972) TaxID=679716 RepID=D0A4V3_TRYB9|nr:hypothetical protein, conserved [Trypanosoma brucei gambiense DAL972]CBH16297.1 hypothetical protein, conserved [Trypanosoma brucei gambiense DAL972]|eukprot:XP_011778561.1 hypothetical protein, conserved [Trypanosoma brucei gambiense DAL972]
MSSRLTLQSYSAWPMSIDLDMLRAYTAGHSIDKTLRLMLDAAAASLKGDEGRGYQSLPSPGTELFEQHLSESAARGRENCPAECEVEVAPPSDDNCVINEECRKENGSLLEKGSAPSSSARRTFHEELQRILAVTATEKSVYLRKEIEEQFNIFDVLRDNYLATPYAFLSSYAICMPLKDRRLLVEEYYSVNEEVLKFFFGDGMHKMEPDGEPETRFLFWSRRPKRCDDREKLRCAGISDGSLKRQWENLKHVCTFLHSAYRGRGGKVISRNTPLLTALQRCFALRGFLGVDYATFVFGFEHQLKNRFCEKLSYAECTNLCNVLATMWCDGSRLMLRQSFCNACARIARLLDENRVIAEIHQMMFGEAMRPRWQQQLDGMQRVIATNKGACSANNSRTEVATPAPVAPPAMASVSVDVLPPDADDRFLDSDSRSRVVSADVSLKREGDSCAFASSHGAPVACQDSNNTVATVNLTVGSPATVGAAVSSNTGPSFAHLSANGAFSRRFIFEYSSIIKFLSRIAAVIGSSGAMCEALDIFYNRVYVSLENLGARSASSPGGESNITRTGAVSSPVVDTKRNNTVVGFSKPVGTVAATSCADDSGFVARLPKWSQSNSDERVPLLPGTPASGAASAPCVIEACTRCSKGQQLPVMHRTMSCAGVASSTNIAGAADWGVHLREACVFFRMLPNVFVKLTQITEEDHLECDNEFTSLVVTLKMLVQIIMASEDRNIAG